MWVSVWWNKAADISLSLVIKILSHHTPCSKTRNKFCSVMYPECEEEERSIVLVLRWKVISDYTDRGLHKLVRIYAKVQLGDLVASVPLEHYYFSLVWSRSLTCRRSWTTCLSLGFCMRVRLLILLKMMLFSTALSRVSLTYVRSSCNSGNSFVHYRCSWCFSHTYRYSKIYSTQKADRQEHIVMVYAHTLGTILIY